MSKPTDAPLGPEYYQSFLDKLKVKYCARQLAEGVVFPVLSIAKPLDVHIDQQFDNRYRESKQVITVSDHRSNWDIVYAAQVTSRLQLAAQIFPMKADFVRNPKTRGLFHALGGFGVSRGGGEADLAEEVAVEHLMQGYSLHYGVEGTRVRAYDKQDQPTGNDTRKISRFGAGAVRAALTMYRQTHDDDCYEEIPLLPVAFAGLADDDDFGTRRVIAVLGDRIMPHKYAGRKTAVQDMANEAHAELQRCKDVAYEILETY